MEKAVKRIGNPLLKALFGLLALIWLALPNLIPSGQIDNAIIGVVTIKKYFN